MRSPLAKALKLAEQTVDMPVDASPQAPGPMFHVDVLSAYLICGVSALVGAAMLRIAETDDPSLRRALRFCGWSMITFGLGLLPAGLGSGAAHPVAQFALGFGSLAGMVLMAHGLGQMQGRQLSARWLWAPIPGAAHGQKPSRC